MPKTSKSTGGTDKHYDKFVQLGLTISYYRRLKGLSQGELAEKVGLSKTHIGNVEAPVSRTSVSLEALFDIADALDVPVGKFFDIR